MLHGFVLYPGGADDSFITSLHTIKGVKWEKHVPSQSKRYNGSRNELLPSHCNLAVILDPEYTSFDFLSGLVRSGCHLFMTESLRMSHDERAMLSLLAEEGNTMIQIRNDLLLHPSLSNAAKKCKELKLIEIHHIAPGKHKTIQEMLYSNLLMVLKIADSEPSRLSVCTIPDADNQPGIINLHLNFHNGSAASLTLSFNGGLQEHLLTIHSANGVKNYDFKESGQLPVEISPMPEITQLYRNGLLLKQIANFTESILRKNYHRYYQSEEARTFQLIEKINRKLELTLV